MDTDNWTFPAAWKSYLLKGYPSKVKPQASHLRQVYTNLHSARRDTEGRFNQLDAGRPAMNRAFLRDLDTGMAEEMEFRRARALPTWDEVKAAMERARRTCPTELRVLEYFQLPPFMRPMDVVAFCRELEVDDSTLYRMRHRAILAVWLQLEGQLSETWQEPEPMARES